MHKITYEMMINAMQNDDTKSLIGDIDLNAIKKNDVESLFYEFPLIERIVLEIYKLLPLSDVEHYNQGTMRTILEILRKDPNSYFPEQLIKVLQKYYGDCGLRNKLFHITDDIGNVTINRNELDFQELKFSIMQLISILRNTYGKYSIKEIGNIKKI